MIKRYRNKNQRKFIYSITKKYKNTCIKFQKYQNNIINLMETKNKKC